MGIFCSRPSGGRVKPGPSIMACRLPQRADRLPRFEARRPGRLDHPGPPPYARAFMHARNMATFGARLRQRNRAGTVTRQRKPPIIPTPCRGTGIRDHGQVEPSRYRAATTPPWQPARKPRSALVPARLGAERAIRAVGVTRRRFYDREHGRASARPPRRPGSLIAVDCDLAG